MRDQLIETSVDVVSGTESLDVGDLHEAFANERRRLALDVLTGESTPLDVETLAQAIAAREGGASSDSVAEERTERIHAMLYHAHLPKLADLGLIEYDPDDGVVTDYVDALGSISF